MQSRHRPGEPFELEAALDSKSIWLAMAMCLMLAGLLFSQSRSGLLGAFAALLYFAWRSRATPDHETSRLGDRRPRHHPGGCGDVRRHGCALDAGSELGFRRARGAAVDLASNAAGGSRLLAGREPARARISPSWSSIKPCRACFTSATRTTSCCRSSRRAACCSGCRWRWRSLRAFGWWRSGCARTARRSSGCASAPSAGMLALFTQNMVEMTLRVPANAVLFAILAAIALHGGPQSARRVVGRF